MKLRMNITAPEPIYTAYFINASTLCICMRISPIVANHRIGKHIRTTMVTNYNKIIVRVAFYAVSVLSEDSLWVCLCIPSFSISPAEAVA